MKTLKRIFIALIAIIAILIIIAFILPGHYKVERSTTIRSNPRVIYDLAGHFNKWDIWTAWNKSMDSTMVYSMHGEDGMVGTSRSWEGKKAGTGEMKFTELKPGELVAYDLMFDHGKYTSKGKIVIEKQGDSCKVSWFDEGELGYNPIARYMGLFMDKMMGPDFEKGLANLKRISEERANWPVIEVKNIPEQVALLIRDSAGPKEYAKVMGKGYMEIMTYIHKNKVKCSNPPFAIYQRWDSAIQFSVLDLGAIVVNPGKNEGRIRVETLPAHKAVVAHYFGPYEKTASTYMALDKYIKESGFTQAGGPMEIYITDPMVEKDTTKWATDILFPVK
jgi:effector-binding domain-containing protein